MGAIIHKVEVPSDRVVITKAEKEARKELIDGQSG